jgi:septum formation protein
MNDESLPERLILASTSKYREMLLQRLDLAFDCISPGTDETALEGESPNALVSRLASQKARAVASKFPTAAVIGSDQMAVLNGEILGKPGNHQAAVEQLRSCSGQTVEFLTAVSVQHVTNAFNESYTDVTRVCFRSLMETEIESYLRREKPYDCAGSFKSESLGVTLFENITSTDPTALIGLPLIRTAAMLRRVGFGLP